jgi:hypothetical protein
MNNSSWGLPCAHHGCNRAVAPGNGYCEEHEPPAPRILMTGSYQPRNLDDELHAAKIRRSQAKAALEAAERHLEETEAAVARWDGATDDD